MASLRRSFAFSVCALLSAASASAQSVPAPTFTRDIAPIFQAKCEGCHRPDQMAPMSLVTYEDVRPWVKSIAARVSGRQMPPWHIDRSVGIQKFKNDRSLTDDQLATVLRWIASGAPKGDPKDLPPAVTWNDNVAGWQGRRNWAHPTS